jgi:prevent-host-death family protein
MTVEPVETGGGCIAFGACRDSVDCVLAMADRSTVIHVIGIGQLRSDTCNYINRVSSGETFEIVRRGRPVARMRPFEYPRGQFTTAVPLDSLRTRASHLMDRVAAGETVTIEHRGRIVAVLQALEWVRPGKPRRLNSDLRSTAVM